MLSEDLRYQTLEAASQAMQYSQQGMLAEAQQLLETAYIRLQSADAAVLSADAGLVDQLKATVLSNLGVVECHKKELDKSLDHLEAALAIEKRIGIFSPTTALNLCATFNALGRYEEAVDICSGAVQALMATNGGVPTDENKTLWAAAWHNLSVAEMNLGGAHGGTDERRVAVLNMFRNAMRASVDLLGPKHPLTATIHESYRAARPQLKQQGAYKIRDSFLPMLSNSTTAASAEKRRGLCTQTLTEDEKLGSVPAYEGALAGNTGRTNIDAAASRRVPSLLNAVRKAQRGDAFRPTHTLVRAQPLYLSHHPATLAAPRQSEALLQPKQREARNRHVPSIASRAGSNAAPGGSSPLRITNNRKPSPAKKRAIAQTARAPPRIAGGNSQRSPVNSASASARGFNPATHKVLSSLSGGGGGGQGGGEATAWTASSNTAKQRSIEQALIGDMWVEVEIPLARRGNSPPYGATRGVGGAVPALRQPGGSPLAWGGGYQTGEFRAPAYGQAMHVIEPSDPIMERVAHPSAYASLDSASMMQPPQQQQYASYAPLPPLNQAQQQQQQSRAVPHPAAAMPMQQQQQQPAIMSLAMQPNATAAPAHSSHSPQLAQHDHAGSPPIPQPPKRPASSGTRQSGNKPPSRPGSAPQQQQQGQGQGQGGFAIFADALGNDIQKYPGLALLSTM